MKAKSIVKKAVAGVLTLAMALGIAPVAIGGGIESWADSTSTPTLGTYAAKAQMVDNTFTPDETTGTSDNIGRINFGMAAWFLLGGDGQNNVDVFATSNIKKMAFGTLSSSANEQKNKSVPATAICDYSPNDAPTLVYESHYGASDVRAALQDMVKTGNTEYFSDAQKAMMNVVTVTTLDKKKSCDYTTSDKLYLATATSVSATNIIVAQDKKLGKDPYVTGNVTQDTFWLRPSRLSGNAWNGAATFSPNPSVSSSWVDSSLGVRPAANLDLSDVLFASAAKAAGDDAVSGTIDNTDTATVMDLRLEAKASGTTITKGQIGSAISDAAAGTISVTKGTGSDIALVVQGKNSDDWYYSKPITEDVTVSTSDIAAATSISADDIDLANCKVWLESTDETEQLIYAVEAAEKCTVTFHNNNGSDNTQVSVAKNSTVAEPTDVVKEGYSLDGWYKAEDLTGDKYDFTAEVTGNMDLYAKWTPVEYQITYQGLEDATFDDGAVNPTEYTIETGDITLNNPTKEGFVFAGWTGSNGTTPSKTVTIAQGSTGNKTYVANWTTPTVYCTVTFHNNNGTDDTKEKVVKGGTVAQPTDVAKDGYKLDGWYTNSNLTGEKYSFMAEVTEDIDLYAKWTKSDSSSDKDKDNTGGDSDKDKDNGNSGKDKSNTANTADKNSGTGSSSDQNSSGSSSQSTGSDSSATGDYFRLAPIIALIVLSGGTIVGVMVSNKRKRNS